MRFQNGPLPEGAIEDLELAKIIDSAAIQSMMDDFYRVARIPMGIIDLKGKFLVGVGWQEICVRFHRVHPETRKRCIESDLQLAAGIPAGEFRLYKCLNNMWDIATPIVVRGRPVGNVFSGQFFFDDEPINYDLFRSQAGRYGFDEKEYIAALEAVPRLSRENVNAGMSFFTKIADIIARVSYKNIDLARSLAERDALMVSLQENRHDLNRAQAVALTGSWRLDVRRNELTWSDETYRIFGVPRGTPLTYEKFLSTVHPEDREWVDWKWSAAMRGEPYDIEHRIVVGDTVKWVRERAELDLSEEGSLLGGFGTVQDITERKRTEEALRESEERHRSIFENSMDGIILSFPDGRIVAANPEACRMHGYTEAEICRLGREGIADKSDPRLSKLVEDRCRTGRHRGEVTHVRRDGTKFPCETSSVVFKDKHGREASVLIIRDITERKRSEEALRQSEVRYRLISENSADVIWVMDASSRKLTYVSPSVEKLRGYTPAEVMAQPISNALTPESWRSVSAGLEKRLQAFIADGSSTRSFITEVDQWHKDGSVVHTEVTTTYMYNEHGKVEIVGVTRDITKRKHMEEELHRSHDELELRVRQRTAELERKNQELQEFAFVASHDLKEPLRKVQTLGSMLAAKSADRLGEEEKDYISRMIGAANRMQELLTALLNYSRIEAKGVEFIQTPLNDVVRDVISDIEVGILKAGAQVRVGTLPIVRGDPNQLRQLFQNLIGNAIKYRRLDVATEIYVSGEESKGASRIFVEDNGIGFDEKYLEKIFQPFQRLHGKHEYSGLGIGLAICRKIVERHGGTITAKGNPGKGSTFIIELPKWDSDMASVS